MAHTFAGGFDEAHEARGLSAFLIADADPASHAVGRAGVPDVRRHPFRVVRFAADRPSRRGDVPQHRRRRRRGGGVGGGVGRRVSFLEGGVGRRVSFRRGGSPRIASRFESGDGILRRGRRRAKTQASPRAPRVARGRAPSLCHLAASPLGAPEASVQLISESPLLLVFDNFLAAEECAELMSIAEPDLRRSRVTDGKLSGRTNQQ